MMDLIERQATIDEVDSETVSTNPDHFKSSEKFIKFMNDADIASFGKWQWANGFNTALVAIKVLLKKLPSAQPIRCKDCKYRDENWRRVSVKWLPCMEVRTGSNWYCGSAERGEQDDK